MAVTRSHVNNHIIKWRKQVYREFRRGNAFSPYMGESPTSIIQVLRDLRDGGDILNVPIVGGLSGPGVSTGPLVGNEESFDDYGMRMWVDWSRNAVLLTRAQMRKTAIEQLDLVRPLLTEWQQTLLRDELILAFTALPSEAPPVNWGSEATAGMRVNGILYDLSTDVQKDKWHDDNEDRILYGGARGNYIGGDHAASLAMVDAVGGRITAGKLLLMKRMARAASPAITPFRDNEDQGREWFVFFCGSNIFRDLAEDPTIVQANLQARAREGSAMDRNPVFVDGDLLYRGVIIREVPEMDGPTTIPEAGAGGIDVGVGLMCGQNAIALAWGQMPRPTERREDDYGFLIGRGVESVYGIGKVFKAEGVGAGRRLIQWGVVTGYFASIPDE
jgi:hypothetical protein